MILFNSLGFLFRFLPVFLIIYYLTPARHRDIVLFGGSVIFYSLGAGWIVLVLLGLTAFNYLLGNRVWKAREAGGGSASKRAAAVAAGTDAGVLVLCKVIAGVSGTFTLPLGFSFFLFKMISYQADLFRGEIRTKPSVLSTAVYFTMFPQITQGPIMRYNVGEFQKKERRVSIRAFNDGLYFFALGLGMKVLLADQLSILWNEIEKIGYESISTPLAWMGAFGYSLQLYMDFWGYSLMAAGIGMMLGFHFVINFIHPYWACGISDFYRRWHATLGTWFRDYIYIPLGGSRRGTLRTILNLLLVWALTGLWHGGTLNFLIWGIALGLLIIWEKFAVKGLLQRAPIIGHLHVWILIPLTWVVFAITDLGNLRLYFSRLFPLFSRGFNVNSGDFGKYFAVYWPFLLAAAFLCAPHGYRAVVRYRKTWIAMILMGLVFWFSVYRIVISASNPFMYFSF